MKIDPNNQTLLELRERVLGEQRTLQDSGGRKVNKRKRFATSNFFVRVKMWIHWVLNLLNGTWTTAKL